MSPVTWPRCMVKATLRAPHCHKWHRIRCSSLFKVEEGIKPWALSPIHYTTRRPCTLFRLMCNVQPSYMPYYTTHVQCMLHPHISCEGKQAKKICISLTRCMKPRESIDTRISYHCMHAFWTLREIGLLDVKECTMRDYTDFFGLLSQNVKNSAAESSKNFWENMPPNLLTNSSNVHD